MAALHSRLPPQPSRPSGKAAALPRKIWTTPSPLSLPPDQALSPLYNASATSPCKDHTIIPAKSSPESVTPDSPNSLPKDPLFPCSPLLPPPDLQVSQVGPPSSVAAEIPPQESEKEGKRPMYRLVACSSAPPLLNLRTLTLSICSLFYCGLTLFVLRLNYTSASSAYGWSGAASTQQHTVRTLHQKIKATT